MSRVSSKEGLLNEPETVRERVAATLTSGATNLLTRQEHANRLIPVASPAQAKTITLPAAKGTGDEYEFINTAARTSGSLIILAHSGDVMNGTIHYGIASTSASLETVYHMTNAYKVTLNNTTTGGLGGDWLRFIDGADGLWYVQGQVYGSGDLASAFTVTS